MTSYKTRDGATLARETDVFGMPSAGEGPGQPQLAQAAEGLTVASSVAMTRGQPSAVHVRYKTGPRTVASSQTHSHSYRRTMHARHTTFRAVSVHEGSTSKVAKTGVDGCGKVP